MHTERPTAWRRRMLLGLCVAAPLGYLGVFALYPLVYQAYGSSRAGPACIPSVLSVY